MKKFFKQIVTLVLCLALCIGHGVPVKAANELGITFSATLDKQSIEKADVAQTVVMTLSASSVFKACVIGFDIIVPEGLTVSAVSAGTGTATTDWDYNDNAVNWMLDSAEDVENIGQEIVSITFEVPANIAADTYTVGIENLVIADTYGQNQWENGGSATATFTVTEGTVAEGYTAGISAESSNVEVGDVVKIPVAVSHDAETSFNACEIKVSYDSSVLIFSEEKSTLGDNVGVSAVNGALTLEDYGADKTCGTSVYILAFEATDVASNSKVELISAAFSNDTNAATMDLTVAAKLSPASVVLNIAERALEVTIDNTMFAGDATVAYGDDYTFSLAENGEYYDYTNISATMGGEAVTVLDNNNGTYTIENVTAALVISATRMPKSYGVTFDGTGAEDVAAVEGNSTSATYLTDYTFTMPADTTENYYKLDNITIGGTAYTSYAVSEGVYTIPGEDVKGAVVIGVSKTAITADSVKVTIEGNGAGVASGAETVVMGESYTLTLTPEAGYLYEVAATMDGESANVTDNGNNTYTIKAVSGAIVFTITRSIDTSGVSVSATEYVKLDGTNVWLVTNTTAVADGKVPTYDGQKMFWSDKYNGGQGAYCYLVVGDTLSVDDARAKLDIASGTKTTVDYGMDVNMTGLVDASDAQLTYNIYNAMYAGFITDVTVEKYLRADVNGDAAINVNDAAAIVTYILNPTAVN